MFLPFPYLYCDFSGWLLLWLALLCSLFAQPQRLCPDTFCYHFKIHIVLIGPCSFTRVSCWNTTTLFPVYFLQIVLAVSRKMFHLSFDVISLLGFGNMNFHGMFRIPPSDIYCLTNPMCNLYLTRCCKESISSPHSFLPYTNSFPISGVSSYSMLKLTPQTHICLDFVPVSFWRSFLH